MSQEFSANSQFYSTNIVFIEELYQKYLKDPNSIDKSWADFFNKNKEEVTSILADYSGPSWAKRNNKILNISDYDISSFAKNVLSDKKSKDSSKDGNSNELVLKLKLITLINSYRRYGHLASDIDPLNLYADRTYDRVDYKNHELTDEDLEKEVEIKNVLNHTGKIKIKDAIEKLDYIYCNKVGYEFDHLVEKSQIDWFSTRIEEITYQKVSKDEQLKALKELIRTEGFEQFLHKKFPGAKRFSVEGGEASIIALEKIIDCAAKKGVKEVSVGMAHRGRLNVLTGVMGKPYYQLLAEFQGVPGIPEAITKSGDVKYHMGYSSSREIDGNKINLTLAFNPSHLEAVNSVVTGKVRAKQKLLKDQERDKAFAILIHGDAAFMGQGSVLENLVMNGVKGYDTGGVVHIIVNNQIGFTANPVDSRSTRYASDLAKAINAPIIHVNGDDINATLKASELAFEYRAKFKKDVVIDVVCYRKYGHNEGDEPLYTQPIMYQLIKNHSSVLEIYSKYLINNSFLTEEEYKRFLKEFDEKINEDFSKSVNYKATEPDWLKGYWSQIRNSVDKEIYDVKTSIKKEEILELANKFLTIPDKFVANSKIIRQIEAKKKTIEEEAKIDWSLAESFAFASLLNEGYPVRISGQDAKRGTFSHRHSILFDQETGEPYSIYSPISVKYKFDDDVLSDYQVYDSVLSEFGVLAFEYGYSLAMPYGLTIWEAQFGDFANGAQVIFDQFISSSEMKWLRKSGLVMLLPHGYEGQGPEHSSARLERFLQLCAENNMRVCNITSPANFFHALRRQVLDSDRKPLIVMSPKSLLRHRLATSSLEEFENKSFQEIIPENDNYNKNKIVKVVLCSGKIYYDLIEAREERKVTDTAIIRIEQIYPFAKEKVKNELKKYKNAKIIWCQEEPKNMGAWDHIDRIIEECLVEIKHSSSKVDCVSRPAAASPATGYGSYHAKEQKTILDEVFLSK